MLVTAPLQSSAPTVPVALADVEQFLVAPDFSLQRRQARRKILKKDHVLGGAFRDAETFDETLAPVDRIKARSVIPAMNEHALGRLVMFVTAHCMRHQRQHHFAGDLGVQLEAEHGDAPACDRIVIMAVQKLDTAVDRRWDHKIIMRVQHDEPGIELLEGGNQLVEKSNLVRILKGLYP